MIQEILDQRGPSQSRGQGQMSFRCFLDIINKFRSTKPTLLAFDIPILGIPSDFAAKDFKVVLGLTHFFLHIQVSIKELDDDELWDT
jgi:hypothetical protein